MFVLTVYVILVLFTIFYLLFSCLIKVQIGIPPVNELVIVYKYSYLKSKVNLSSFKSLNLNTSHHKEVKLCYFGRKKGHLEYAHGIILNEQEKFIDTNLLTQITKTDDINVFCTPAINHALFIVIPIIRRCLFTKLLAVLYGYPKLNQFAMRYKLCAYPVVEIYSDSTVTFVLPLVRQDEFVVAEAEQHVFGLSYPPFLRHVSRVKLKTTTSLAETKTSTKRQTKG